MLPAKGHGRTSLLVRRLQISRQGRQPRLSLTPQPFRYRSFGSSLPNTDGMRLPCRTLTDCPGKAVSVTRPSSDSPRTLPRASYSGHSPPQRHARFNDNVEPISGDQPDCRSASSGRRCGSCVSVDLRLRVHVARACYRPIRSGVSRLPANRTFPANCQRQSHRISPYESRSSGYRS